jgi:hypothetical protein
MDKNQSINDPVREGFETAAVSLGMHDLTRHGEGEYLRDPLNLCWLMWQAALASPSASALARDEASGQEPVAWRWEVEVLGAKTWQYASHWSTGPKDAQPLYATSQAATAAPECVHGDWKIADAQSGGNSPWVCGKCGSREAIYQAATAAVAQDERAASEYRTVSAALTGLARHIRACEQYRNLVGDMEMVDKAIALLAASQTATATEAS